MLRERPFLITPKTSNRLGLIMNDSKDDARQPWQTHGLAEAIKNLFTTF